MENLKYLFPFEKIEHGSKILIYGAGEVGRSYLKQVIVSDYCKVVGFVDRNVNISNNMLVPIYRVTEIQTLDFDYVVLAFRISIHIKEVTRVLCECGVSNDRIIYVPPRDDVNIYIQGKQEKAFDTCIGNRYSMAVHLSGGIGDLIIQKRFLYEIIKCYPEVCIDIYALNNNVFLKYLYSDCENVKNVIFDSGERYLEERGKYSVALNIASILFVHVDIVQEDILKAKYPIALSKLKKLEEESRKESFNLHTPVQIVSLCRMYKGYNAYTGFNYNGTFEINDKKVSMPLIYNEKYASEKEKIGNYFTINCGNGLSSDARGVSKAWPPSYFEQLIKLIRQKYSQLVAVQISGAQERKLISADVHYMGESFEFVSNVLNESLFHIDIEGGLVHIASQLQTKCFVLFGPTPVEYFGYENNCNITTGNCHGCFGIFENPYLCVRDMDEPECMYGITPEFVFSQIEKYIDENAEIFKNIS